MAKSRARIIDNDVLEVIQELLDSWSGKLTWDLLIAEIKNGIRIEYTRQALANHKIIVEEFNLRKRMLRLEAGRPEPTDSRIAELQKKIDKLEIENQRLSDECNNYRAMFFVWVKNAEQQGLSEKQLSKPLLASQLSSTDDIIPIYDLKRRKKKS